MGSTAVGYARSRTVQIYLKYGQDFSERFQWIVYRAPNISPSSGYEVRYGCCQPTTKLRKAILDIFWHAGLELSNAQLSL